MEHPTTTELEAGLDEVRNSPADNGTLDLIVRRPDVDEREVLQVGELSIEEGLVGDNWILCPPHDLFGLCTSVGEDAALGRAGL